MITGTVPETVNLKHAETLPGKEVLVITEKTKKSFIYIGNRGDRTVGCMSFFDYSYIINSFEEAKKLLTSLYEAGSTPDFIVVDLPLDLHQFSDFSLWLHSNKWSFMIPVLYNETVLKTGELDQLKEANVADDIVNIEDYCNRLSPKARLIAQSKINKQQKPGSNYNNDDLLDHKMMKTSFGKRVFDIIIASIVLLLTLPLSIIIAICIKLESKGPVIYKSKRAGRGFKVFDFYKFRTMIQGADKIIDEYSSLNTYSKEKNESMFIKLKDDPRVTRFGRILRNTSLDELPQLINVIKGDMSIVGNRPLPLYEASTLTTNKSAERFSAPAGITGLWQVTKRGREDMDIEERIDLDVNYAKNQSMGLDFRILIMTPFALLQKSNV